MSLEARTESHADLHWGVYLKAWVVLLGITIAMVLISKPWVLLLGMSCKALIIMLWFMHLKYEKLDFVLYVIGCTFITSLVLFGLIAPDGIAISS